MSRVDAEFRDRVEALVSQIPRGKVMTYGQIASLCGAAWAAWEVGQIAHYGDPKLPWQRVVNKKGGLANGYPGGPSLHQKELESENIEIKDDHIVNMESVIWWPK